VASNIPVSFKVTGGELSNYIDQIQKKADGLTNSTIKSALEQSEQSKKQLSIINEIIAATERKNRIEAQAARSVLLEKREQALTENKQSYDQKREQLLADKKAGKLSFNDYSDRVEILRGNEKEDAHQIRNNYRDELSTLKEQDRQSKLQTLLTKEQIQISREAAREQVSAIKNGDKALADVYREVGQKPTEEEKLTLKLIEQQLGDEKKEKKGTGGGMLGSLLTVDNITKLSAGITNVTQTQNGFDAIQSTSNTAGRIAGGILGAIVGSFFGGVGAFAGAAAGSTLLGEIMGDAGAVLQKQGLMSQDFVKARNRYKAVTGMADRDESLNDLSSVGVAATDFYKLRAEIARKKGVADTDGKSTRDAIFLDRGYGVDQGTSGGLFELMRSSRDGNRDLARLVGGIIDKGQGSIFRNGDTTFLNEFLGRFTATQKELLKTNTTIASGLTMDVLKQFNGMGGMFDARDYRSGGLVSSINNSLSNPSSDNIKALAFGVLRGQKPNAGIFDLREEMQKGLGSPAYLKGMIEMVERMGGDDQMKMNNLSGMFQGVPLSAIRTLFRHRKELRSFNTSELNSIGISESVLRGKAEENTAPIERITAENTNKVLAGMPWKAATDAIRDAFKETMSGAVIQLENGQIHVTSNAAIRQNITKRAVETNKAAEREINQMMDIHSTYRTGF
jgi:hypothetical protein